MVDRIESVTDDDVEFYVVTFINHIHSIITFDKYLHRCARSLLDSHLEAAAQNYRVGSKEVPISIFRKYYIYDTDCYYYFPEVKIISPALYFSLYPYFPKLTELIVPFSNFSLGPK